MATAPGINKTARRYGREDLKHAHPIERRYALAHLRWLAGGEERREGVVHYNHAAYNQDGFVLTQERSKEIESQIEQMVLDAFQTSLRRSELAPARIA